MSAHPAPHPLAGQTAKVTLAAPLYGQGSVMTMDVIVEDWNDRVFGRSWMDMDSHMASLAYAMRSAAGSLPIDNEVVYGKVHGFGHLIHVSEIDGGEVR
ncbi:hypothetical protein [Streptomyces sp. NPDC059928]|uniref:hypothetical protein n=1 Tax=unclassified Streptomyces TaxID=2593676 RepID=UPI0036662E54